MMILSRSVLGAGLGLALLGFACSPNDHGSDAFAPDTLDPILLSPDSDLGLGQMGGSGSTTEQYTKADVTRNGVNYRFMANGWGPGWMSHSIAWSGTSFTIETLEGSEGADYEPAAYPTVFCGNYSREQSGACGLPADIDSLASLRTGWWWDPHGNDGEYNAAYDVWLGDSNGTFIGYFMVWYRLPAGQFPAGERKEGVTVGDIPGTWGIYEGTVWDGRPIINYVRARHADTHALEFDLLDFFRDAESRGYVVPGTRILAVAVGFEIWNGPVSNLETKDFYVDVQAR